MYAIPVFLELYMFQYLMLCMACLLLAGCMTVLAHCDPKLGVVQFQSDT